jgi:hypothetical protein
MEKIIIEKVNGKWLINGKTYTNINDDEKKFFDEFILFMKWEQGKDEFDKRNKVS